MRKTLNISIGIVTVVIIMSCTAHLYYTSPESRGTVIKGWATCIGSFGSFVAVIVALYKDTLLAWMNAPDLRMKVGNQRPLCTVENSMAGGSTKETGQYVEICAVISNVGVHEARRCRIICEELYTTGADGKYSPSDEHQFRPYSFPWSETKSSCDVDIANGMKEYVKLAEIRTPASELGDESEAKGTEKNSAKTFLVICLPNKSARNKYIELEPDCKSVIIPIQLVCAGAKPRLKFVKIIWNGKAIKDYIKDHKKLAVIEVDPSSKELPKKEVHK